MPPSGPSPVEAPLEWAALLSWGWDWLCAHGRLGHAAAAGVLGLMVGSFLNVAAYRWPRGLSLMWPPSSCPSCAARIRARDNLPLLGWLRLRGRCRGCGWPIPARYPLVEALGGGLWAATAFFWVWPLRHGAAEDAGLALAAMSFVTLLAAAALIDWDTRLIPDGVSLGGAAMALAASALLPALHAGLAPDGWWIPCLGRRGQSVLACLAGMALGAGLMGAITVLGTLAFRKKLARLRQEDPDLDTAVGEGDTRLMLLIGGFLGPAGVLAALFWGICAGGVAGLAIKWLSGRWPEGRPRARWSSILGRWRGGDAVMPLGPWLAAGAVAALWGGDGLRQWMLDRLLPKEGTGMGAWRWLGAGWPGGAWAAEGATEDPGAAGGGGPEPLLPGWGHASVNPWVLGAALALCAVSAWLLAAWSRRRRAREARLRMARMPRPLTGEDTVELAPPARPAPAPGLEDGAAVLGLPPEPPPAPSPEHTGGLPPGTRMAVTFPGAGGMWLAGLMPSPPEGMLLALLEGPGRGGWPGRPGALAMGRLAGQEPARFFVTKVMSPPAGTGRTSPVGLWLRHADIARDDDG